MRLIVLEGGVEQGRKLAGLRGVRPGDVPGAPPLRNGHPRPPRRLAPQRGGVNWARPRNAASAPPSPSAAPVVAASAAGMSHLAGVLLESAVRQACARSSWLAIGCTRARNASRRFFTFDKSSSRTLRAAFSRLSALARSSSPSTEASRSCNSDWLAEESLKLGMGKERPVLLQVRVPTQS